MVSAALPKPRTGAFRHSYAAVVQIWRITLRLDPSIVRTTTPCCHPKPLDSENGRKKRTYRIAGPDCPLGGTGETAGAAMGRSAAGGRKRGMPRLRNRRSPLDTEQRMRLRRNLPDAHSALDQDRRHRPSPRRPDSAGPRQQSAPVPGGPAHPELGLPGKIPARHARPLDHRGNYPRLSLEMKKPLDCSSGFSRLDTVPPMPDTQNSIPQALRRFPPGEGFPEARFCYLAVPEADFGLSHASRRSRAVFLPDEWLTLVELSDLLWSASYP